jgi:L-ribulose-5-phosphate 3-epimerase UlaE
VRANESAITIIALALGICLTLTLVFGNFSLAYLVKLFAEGRLPFGNALFVFAVTIVNLAVLGFLARWWLRTIRALARLESSPVSQQPQPQNNQQRWQEAKEKVLELAHSQPSIAIHEIMQVTNFNRIECEYLLDDLLSHNLLSVYQEAGEFRYRLEALTT